ncbi:MAG TPA: helix-turn-helix domain-containing protein [Gordonia sp. (in: high G+C Gram-positive bacteria)]|uniref:TetR/AcrR family transcriptional regulator n=1 Tax=unclassified Gordonia (in: high G+C Gram-positive bacteria) TaxID=2657482 RepID=UPI000F948606|nr:MULTISPECIES: TetR/AcrR family transcriptional regulator [unclassified Gordonia (in: high G+C Gram-positive bacteria)]RUP37845.1 MAG: TetR/AcrR family transcriptional regulator [Gordonia sp. (in: high G+C Gram-positive bacteria)]HNP57651.1 helix-turn-helix domain-containing protein [Gordonia sp. (in: high G+C Gram-positive bacteria)]HRC50704.1 helix-turn-helix domain-containing protein [Gordonia sp. (in: high G+C Gram-positive bacteria)]
MSSRKARSTATVEDQESAILHAAANEFAAVGARRANMDEVAAAAGVSRSTLYRRFPNKDSLLLAVASEAYERGMRQLEEAVAGLGPREAVVEAFATGAEMISTDPLLSRMVLEDYEVRNFADSINTLFIDIVTERIVATMRAAGAQMPDDLLHQAVELHVRLVISYLENPVTDPARTTPEYVRQLAATFLAPMIY